jgi:hypothetical protein
VAEVKHGLGVLVPGRRCDLCGALLTFAAVGTPLGDVFCPSHQDLPNCNLCSAPFHGPGRFCQSCAATSVNTQERVRAVLPGARGILHAMGVILNPPVHVQLVDELQTLTLGTHESGRVAGTATILGQRVTEIHIVSGLPEVEFGATVAHEAMHAWMAQNGFPSLDPAIEEGLCQVVAYRWLRDQADPRAQLIREQLDMSPDPVYGGGFRLVKESVKQYGMNAVLAAVKASGRLP